MAILFFLLGFIDDRLKFIRKSSKGLSARAKFFWQILISCIIMSFLIFGNIVDTLLYIPFYKGALWDLGFWYIPFGALVIVASSNAVNLTDGLDGLAIGPIMTSAASLGVIAYFMGHSELARYLYIPYYENVGELVVFSAAIIGAGFWFFCGTTRIPQRFLWEIWVRFLWVGYWG